MNNKIVKLYKIIFTFKENNYSYNHYNDNYYNILLKFYIFVLFFEKNLL